MPLLCKFIYLPNISGNFVSPLNGFISTPILIKLTPAAKSLFQSMECNLVGYRTKNGLMRDLSKTEKNFLEIDYWLKLDADNICIDEMGLVCHTNLLIQREVFKEWFANPYFELDFIVSENEKPVLFDVDMENNKGYLAKPIYFQIHTEENELNKQYKEIKKQ